MDDYSKVPKVLLSALESLSDSSSPTISSGDIAFFPLSLFCSPSVRGVGYVTGGVVGSVTGSSVFGLLTRFATTTSLVWKERKELWKTLLIYKIMVNNNLFVLIGDWNVSLNVEDCSAGGSCKTTDMEDFQKCIEDIICTGIHFTWVQSRLNPSSGILKKIDRIMVRFMNEYKVVVKDWESFLCQQAKIDWLKDGEKNNKLFHNVLKRRKHRARIVMINDEKCNLFEGMNVPEQFMLHFQKFLGTSEHVQQFDTSNLRPVSKVTLKEVTYMVRNVSDEETKQTMYLDILMEEGDPISPYLFTLVMEIFNLILNQKIREYQKFRYHWGCKEMEITSLCFADDLLVLFHGDAQITKVIKEEIDKLLKGFLWNNSDSGKGKAKISWDQVCMPKSQGGWQVKDGVNTSCGWKQLLSLRDKIRDHVFKKVGNGKTTFLWHEKWYDKASTMTATQEIPSIQLNDNEEDTTLWITNNAHLVKYSVGGEEIVLTISALPCNKNILNITRRIMFAACMYYIWKERNKRIFSNEKRSWKELVNKITKIVRLKLSSLRVKHSSHVNNIADIWKVKMNMCTNSAELIDEDRMLF
ncbi:RNA-directed DNA polymerase, eukaryota, reverse transcriptase zinc-binding domain protein [Tanacetum coccineum]